MLNHWMFWSFNERLDFPQTYGGVDCRTLDYGRLYTLLLRPDDLTLLSTIHVEHLAMNMTTKILACKIQDTLRHRFAGHGFAKSSLLVQK